MTFARMDARIFALERLPTANSFSIANQFICPVFKWGTKEEWEFGFQRHADWKPQGYETLFFFLEKNWSVLKEKFGSKTNLWDNLITAATSQFTTQEGLELVSNLYVAHQGEFGSAEHIIEKSMRNVREEAKWSTENLPVIDSWLDLYLASSKKI
ncbi:aminopeptidase N-like [Choristoneura fumiferana]|uniref:aminopeptidase N-like n=1 Tax=Choristoneura fumiferana TaxID=7141 RepID=UPI003D15852F